MESLRNKTKRTKQINSKKKKRLEPCLEKRIIRWEKQGKICTLCNLERIRIAFTYKIKLINQRYELVGKCKHPAKIYLKS